MLSIDKLVTSGQRSEIDDSSMDLMPQNFSSLASKSRTILGVAMRMSLNTGILIFCDWPSVSCFHSSDIVVVWSLPQLLENTHQQPPPDINLQQDLPDDTLPSTFIVHAGYLGEIFKMENGFFEIDREKLQVYI